MGLLFAAVSLIVACSSGDGDDGDDDGSGGSANGGNSASGGSSGTSASGGSGGSAGGDCQTDGCPSGRVCTECMNGAFVCLDPDLAC